MKTSNLFGLLISTLLLLASGQAYAVMLTDTIDASDGQADTYFLPSAADVYADPYFRAAGEDWNWTHNQFVVNESDINSATLAIRAWDIDPPTPFLLQEVDEIWGYNDGAWQYIGDLVGLDDAFSITSFSLGNGFYDEIVSLAGLMLEVRIDTLDPTNTWRVSLDYSELTLDVNLPGAVPLPAAVWLFGSALLGLLGYARRSNKVA